MNWQLLAEIAPPVLAIILLEIAAAALGAIMRRIVDDLRRRES
jgi:hypothetical protein